MSDIEHRLAVLTALQRALADPRRLVSVLADAQDEVDARRRVQDAYGLTDVEAQVVLDGRFGLLTRAHHERLAAELEGLQEAIVGLWDPPLTVRAVLHSPTDVRVTLDDEEHRVEGTDLDDSLDLLARLVRERVAAPQRRRVDVTTTGAVNGLVRVELDPLGNATFVHADEEPGPLSSR